MARKRRSRGLPPEAGSLRARIEEWRRSGVSPGRMPVELWREAEELASRHGVYAVSRGVGVSYGTLKRRVEGADGCASDAGTAVEPRFVEFQPLSGVAGKATSAVTTIELRDGTVQMTIRTSSGSLREAAQLVRAFRLGAA